MYQQSEQSKLSSRLSSGLTNSMASSILSSSSSSSGHQFMSTPLTSGHRDVTATLFATKSSSRLPTETDFTMTSSMISSSGNLDQHPILGNNGRARRDSSLSANRGHNDGSPSLFVIVLSVACIAVLLMPNSETAIDTKANISWYHSIYSYLPLPSSGMKLCAAYVLGVITKLILM